MGTTIGNQPVTNFGFHRTAATNKCT